jgi:ADP-ribosylglycohydrolase
MLLELAIGDAYGAAFEYADEAYIQQHNHVQKYVSRPKGDVAPGQYTDDTQMSIAIAEAILSGEEWTPENIAAWFVEAFHRDPRAGYARGFHTFLSKTTTEEDFLAQIRPDSDKSGAAMRATPIGFYPDTAEVIQRATLQAKLTHDTPGGIASAVAAALMPHYFLYHRGEKEGLGAFLEKHVTGHPWGKPYRGRVGASGWMSVRAAVTSVMRYNRMTDILRACVAFTGDVDTVATLALAAGSCSAEVEQDLPQTLIEGLENHTYGRDYLRSLDVQLFAQFPTSLQEVSHDRI